MKVITGTTIPNIKSKIPRLYTDFGGNSDGAISQSFLTTVLRSSNTNIGSGNTLSTGKTGQVCIGWAAKTSGDRSLSFGTLTNASGDYACAIGSQATASGISSFALGSSTKANGKYSTAIGEGATAQGLSSTAIAFNSKAIGEAAVALGQSCSATANQSLASGFNSDATGIASVAIGSSAHATADGATAIGWSCVSHGEGSIALGAHSEVPTGVSNVVSVGSASGTKRRIINVSPGVNPNDVATVSQLSSGGGSGWTTVTTESSGWIKQTMGSSVRYIYILTDGHFACSSKAYSMNFGLVVQSLPSEVSSETYDTASQQYLISGNITEYQESHAYPGGTPIATFKFNPYMTGVVCAFCNPTSKLAESTVKKAIVVIEKLY